MRMFNKAEFQSFYFIFLGILTVEVCFAIDSRDGSYDDCNVRGGGICYFIGNHSNQTWYRAHGACQDKNSSLPIIRSSEEQMAFETYLNNLPPNELRTNAVWTAGKRRVYNDWTWINGQTLNRSQYRNFKIIPGSAEKTHMQIYMTSSKSELRPADPFSRHWYLCQLKGRQCSDEFAVNATYGCLVPSEANVISSWYDARKSCLSEQGDLAILTDQDIQILRRFRIRNPNFWIGLRKEYWVWGTGLEIKASEGDEVKYTNWATALMRTDGDLCISINANRDKWRTSFCGNETLSVVCEKRGQTQPSTSMNSDITESAKCTPTTQATIGKYPSITSRPTTTRTTIATAVHEHNGDSTKFQADKETNGRTDDSKTGENTSIISGIVAGVVIFILCIVAILVVMCRKSKSSNIKTELAQIDAETMKGSKDENTKEKSSKGNEERCIYAVIPLAEKTTNDALEDGQKGTTYALLDFNKGVTMSIQTNCIQHSDVSGPIYAQPFNAIRNQNETSTGESFSIHSVGMHR